MRRKKKASLPGLGFMSKSDSLQRFAMISLLRSVSEIVLWGRFMSDFFGLLSSLFSKFCPCGEAAGFSQQTKLDISIPCARFWSAWSCFPAVALSTVFYSLCTVPLETFSPPRLREALLFLQAKTPNTPPAGCFWVIPGDVSVEGKMKFFSFCRGTIVKVVSLSQHLTVCGGDRLAEHCSKRWRGLKTEIVIFCWCTLFYTALLSCPLNAEVL